ncbi:MAG: GNAT family N-acetyltransferase [Acidobacteria bacterium]|uniref:GNAT family N-acetyltransferase n=1 Tax=Candidatus Polarisedimenticola svalbardensis TaxID=2886004 RepID=A0A8J6Y7F3_9BACT|nr:GNAT family N-acetyltransferase [Candidatus Polarisedimenticola svalbardensis]
MDNTESMQEPGTLDTDQVLVRTMTEDDLGSVVLIDAASSGRSRPTYFGKLIEKSVKLADLSISLVAELEGRVVGFVVGTLYYGEFGVAEPSASIDVIGVDGRYRRKQVGQALMRQLRINLSALRITSLRTEVSWDDFDLLAFFRSAGFRPSNRLCLERELDPTAPVD